MFPLHLSWLKPEILSWNDSKTKMKESLEFQNLGDSQLDSSFLMIRTQEKALCWRGAKLGIQDGHVVTAVYSCI